MVFTLASCTAIAAGLLATKAPSQKTSPRRHTGVKNVGAAVVARMAVNMDTSLVPSYRLFSPRYTPLLSLLYLSPSLLLVLLLSSSSIVFRVKWRCFLLSSLFSSSSLSCAFSNNERESEREVERGRETLVDEEGELLEE